MSADHASSNFKTKLTPQPYSRPLRSQQASSPYPADASSSLPLWGHTLPQVVVAVLALGAGAPQALLACSVDLACRPVTQWLTVAAVAAVHGGEASEPS